MNKLNLITSLCYLIKIYIRLYNHILHYVLITLLFIISGCTTLTQPRKVTSDDHSLYDFSKAPVIRVPEDASSLNEAILQIDNEGVIVLSSGIYHENITIRSGMNVKIQAKDSIKPIIHVENPRLPVIAIQRDALLYLDGISFSDSPKTIIAGSVRDKIAAREVRIEKSNVSGSEYAIYGYVNYLHLAQSSLEGNRFGLIIYGSTVLENSFFTDNFISIIINGNIHKSCAEASFVETGHTVNINNITIWNGATGGIGICNVTSAMLQNIYLWRNQYYGIQINNTHDFKLYNSKVGETKSVNGEYGDGLIVNNSTGHVKNNQFAASQRANVIYYGPSGGMIESNMMIYGVFALCLEKTNNGFPTVKISSNNYFFGNQENSVSTGNYIPLSPPPQIPKL